jgi:hypothetical protein
MQVRRSAFTADLRATCEGDSSFPELSRQVAHDVFNGEVQRRCYSSEIGCSFSDVIQETQFVTEKLGDLETALRMLRDGCGVAELDIERTICSSEFVSSLKTSTLKPRSWANLTSC